MNRHSQTCLLNRRRFNQLSLLSFLALFGLSARAAVALSPQDKARQGIQRPPRLGTTFSQLQCYYMGLNYKEAFRHIASLGFNCIRLCSYWHEIEPVEGQYQFSTLDWLLEESQKHGLEVILTVGMKAPRWPEFHFPDWFKARYPTGATGKPIDLNPDISNRTLRLIEATVRHTRQAPALKYWQVENEPFTHLEIAGGRFLSPQFVETEIALVRSLALPEQKVLLTNSIALPQAQAQEDDQALLHSLSLADAVGINVYSKVPAGNSSYYLQPEPPFWEKLRSWQQLLTDQGREEWIAEAQAEPWEPNELVAMSKPHYPSSSPLQAVNLVNALTEVGYRNVLLWGCEYWYWQRQRGENFWWWKIQQLINA